jgi:hypothetical protein
LASVLVRVLVRVVGAERDSADEIVEDAIAEVEEDSTMTADEAAGAAELSGAADLAVSYRSCNRCFLAYEAASELEGAASEEEAGALDSGAAELDSGACEEDGCSDWDDSGACEVGAAEEEGSWVGGWVVGGSVGLGDADDGAAEDGAWVGATEVGSAADEAGISGVVASIVGTIAVDENENGRRNVQVVENEVIFIIIMRIVDWQERNMVSCHSLIY